MNLIIKHGIAMFSKKSFGQFEIPFYHNAHDQEEEL